MSLYLQTSYRPDREYVDGEVRERNVGKWEHARVQALLAGWFMNHEMAWGVMVSTEQRLQVATGRVRVPEIVVDPPLLVVEILSPDDTCSDTQERALDYPAMGKGEATVWIVDPRTRTGRMCRGDVWTGSPRLGIPGTPIHVELEQIFRLLVHPYS